MKRRVEMRRNRIAVMPARMFVICLMVLIAALCYSEQKTAAHRSSRAAQPSPGQQIFSANCSGCHGLDGTGSQRAPNIVSNPQVTKLSAAEISRIISHGVPGTGMPGFQHLGSSAIASLTSYVRSLQGNGRQSAVAGNAGQGEKLFFGTAQCANCHMIAGKGGFIGPDLSSYAQTHSAEKIKHAINDPNERFHITKVVTVATNDGRQLHGIVLNEDNFSLQMLTGDGSFHFFSKPDLKTIDRQQGSMMPDYSSRLNSAELNDLVSYLFSIAKDAAPAPKPEHQESE